MANSVLTPVKDGSVFKVHSQLSGYQGVGLGCIGRLSDGGFIATWRSNGQDGSNFGVYGQRFNAAGEKTGGEFRINSYTANLQDGSSVSALNDGGFVVVWQSYGQDGSGYGIYGKRFNAAGDEDGGEFRVSSYAADTQGMPVVTTLTDGGYVVAWQSNGQDGSGYGIYGQIYSAAGDVVGTEFKVNTYTTNSQDGSSISALDDGGFVVVWQSNGQDGNGYGIYGQRFNASGDKSGDEFRVNTYTTDVQERTTVTTLSDGGFVVTWTSYGQDGTTSGVYGQRFTPGGETLGNEFRINSATTSGYWAQVSALDYGGFIVTWTALDGSEHGVWGQRFDANANKIGDTFSISTETANNQWEPRACSLTNGRFVVAWQAYYPSSTGDDVDAQFFSVGDPAGITVADVAVNENMGTATVTVTLSESAANPVTVTYATSDDTATAGSDYTASSGTLILAAGETSKTFTINISDDTTREDDETVIITLSNAVNGLLADDSATLTITDNDTPTVTDSNKDGQEEGTITFTAEDFTNRFSDPNGTALSKIQITALPANGSLRLAGTMVVNDQEIAVTDLANLTFIPNTNWNGATTLQWVGSDGVDYAITPATTTLTLAAVNDVPQVVDNTALFATPVTYGVKNVSWQTILADFNGDTLLDIATTTSDGIAILPGNGDGTFQSQYTIPLSSINNWLGASDLNQDGILDLVHSRADNQVDVLLGKGDGRFGAPAVYAGVYPVTSLVLGDMNQDGITDIVTNSFSDRFSNAATILFGKGDGTFEDAKVYSQIGSGDPVLGDVNNDGKLDLVVARLFNDVFDVHLSNGDGTFSTPLTFSPGGRPGYANLADFNKDGNLDFITSNTYWRQTLSVSLGNGDGTFQSRISIPGSGDPRKSTSADINGDGNLDIVVVGGGNATATIYYGSGTGTFTPDPRTYNAVGTAAMSTAGDLNGDGKTDLVFAYYNGLSVLMNTGFQPVSTLQGWQNGVYSFSSDPFTSCFIDPDGDALAKIKITSLPANGTLTLSGNGVTVDQEILSADLANLVFAPNTDWTGTSGFSWKGSDGSDYSATAATISLVINANALPVVSDGSKSGDEDATLAFTLDDFAASYKDGDSDALSKIKITTLPDKGSLQLSGVAVVTDQEITATDLNNLTFVPNADWHGTTNLAWQGSDGKGYSSSSATMTLTVNNVPDLPWSVVAAGTYNGHTYHAVSAAAGITWAEANAAAQAMGGHLAALTSRGENNFVHDLVSQHPELYAEEFAGANNIQFGPWFGAFQLPGAAEPGGGWQWVTGETFDYANWGYCLDNTYSSGEDSGHYWTSGHNYQANIWNDIYHDNLNGGGGGGNPNSFIVEYDTTSASSLGDGLIAYYTFNGNVRDMSGHGYHGTNHGATLTNDRFGNENSAYSFNPGYIMVDGIDLPVGGDSRTVSAWVKMASGQQSGDDTVLVEYGDYRQDSSFGLFYGSWGSYVFSVMSTNNDLTEPAFPASPGYIGNRYYHLVGTYDDATDTRTLYIDGKQVRQDVTALNTATSSLYIGNTWWTGNIFDGVLDDIRVYDRALSAAEVGQLFTLENVDNSPPVVENVSKTGNEDAKITFTATDFTARFSDADGDALNLIKILSLPENGTLQLAGQAVTANQEITAANLANLTFTPDADWSGTTSFSWNGTDGKEYSSSTAVVSIAILDTTAPLFAAATVTGNTLVMSYTEANRLDGVNKPPANAFTVVSGGTANAVTDVLIDAANKTIALTLTNTVINGQTVTVAYNDPTSGNDTNAIQDAAGNDAPSLAITVTTPLTEDMQEALVGRWSFDDGTARDTSGHGNNGIITNGLSVSGHSGQGLQLNGDGYVRVPSAASLAPSSGITISAWVNVLDFPSRIANLIYKDDATRSNFSYRNKAYVVYVMNIQGYSYHAIELSHSSPNRGPQGIMFSPDNSISEDTWFHVACTIDVASSTRSIYIDGFEVATNLSFSDSSLLTGEGDLFFGHVSPHEADQWSNLIGIIDEIHIYDRALSAEEIQVDKNSTSIPTLAVSDVTVDESAGVATFYVTLSRALTSQVTIGYTTNDGTATASSDYATSKGSLTFAAGETSKTITVTINDDATWENDETLTITLSNSDSTFPINTYATLTITDNDAVVVSDGNKNGDEDGTITFTAANFSDHYSDPNGYPLNKIQITALPANGSLRLAGALVSKDQEIAVGDLTNLTFVPHANWNGTTSFAWLGSNGSNYSSSPATFSLAITTVNDIPAVTNDNKSGSEDTPLSFTANDFTNLFADGDGDSLNTIKITTLPANGSLRLSGGAVTANQEITAANLANLTFSPDANWNGGSSFSWLASDGTAYSSAAATMTLMVNQVNDLPTVANSSKSVSGTNTISFTTADFTSLFTDVDSDSLYRIKITSLPGSGSLRLSGTAVYANQEMNTNTLANLTYTPGPNQSGITSFSWGGHDGTAYSTASATVTITINAVNTPPTVTNISKSGSEDGIITFSATDFSSKFSDINGDALSKVQFTSLPGNGILRLSGLTVTANQEILVNDLANLTFTPTANWFGTTSFAWKGSDGTAYATTSATVNLSVSSVNDLPTISTVSKTSNEDSNMLFSSADFANKFSDPDGGSLQGIKITSLPDNGILRYLENPVSIGQEIGSGGIGDLVFLPVANWNGTTSFGWLGSDGTNYSAEAAAVNLTINGTNDIPLVAGMTLSANKNNIISFTADTFASHFQDIDQQPLDEIQITSLPANGTLRLSGNTMGNYRYITAANLANLTFTPNTNWSGNTSFTWRGGDGIDFSDVSATVTLTINNTNSAPSVNNFTKTGNEDTPIAFAAMDFASKYSDGDGDPLNKIRIAALPNNGILQLAGLAVTVNQEIAATNLANLTFLPDTNWSGASSFSWQGSDGTSYSSANSTVTLTVGSVNDPPTVANGSKTGEEDTPLSFTNSDFATLFTDVDGNALNKIRIATLPTNGSLRFFGLAVTTNQEITATNLANLAFIPNTDWNGTSSFSWSGSDGTTYATTAATFTLSITAVNDTATVSNGTITGLEDTPISFTSSDFTRRFSDGDGNPLNQIKMTALPANGMLLLANQAVTSNQEIATANLANLTFVPNANWNGTTSFTWRGSDGVDYSADALFSLTVTPVNDAPILATPLADQTWAKGTYGSYQLPANIFADGDGEQLSLAVTQADGSPLPSWLFYTPFTRTLAGMPPPAFTGTLALRVQATDGGGAQETDAFTLTIGIPNRSPLVNQTITDQTINGHQLFTFQIPANSFSDPDVGDKLIWSVTQDNNTPLPGWLIFNPFSQTLMGMPGGTSNNSLDVRVTVRDMEGSTASQTFTLNIEPGSLFQFPQLHPISFPWGNLLNGIGQSVNMMGSEESDVYVMDDSDDQITEPVSTGTDLVISMISTTLGDQLEMLRLGGNEAINGFGNDLANSMLGNLASNTLNGGEGDDLLDGQGGGDDLFGGLGNDVFVIRSVDDLVVENAGEGVDSVLCRLSLVLPDNVENLTLSSPNFAGLGRFHNPNRLNTLLDATNPAKTGEGNELDNTLAGNRFANTLLGKGGDDILTGDMGNDTLTGGSGGDIFRFLHPHDGGDQITDFSIQEEDKLAFFSPNFGQLAAGTLSSELFVANNSGTATNTSQRFIFNTNSGTLSYDSDGSGSAAPTTTLATLNILTLTAADVVLFAS